VYLPQMNARLYPSGGACCLRSLAGGSQGSFGRRSSMLAGVGLVGTGGVVPVCMGAVGVGIVVRGAVLSTVGVLEGTLAGMAGAVLEGCPGQRFPCHLCHLSCHPCHLCHVLCIVMYIQIVVTCRG